MKHLLLLTMAARVMWAQPLSKTALERWCEELARRGTTALVVVRQDQIVYEWYAEGWNADRPHYTASTAKSLVGGLSLDYRDAGEAVMASPAISEDVLLFHTRGHLVAIAENSPRGRFRLTRLSPP